MKKTIPIFLAIILALSQVTPTLAIGTPLAIGAPPAIGTPPATSWNTWDITHPNATSSQIEIASTLAWAAGSGATWITISPNFGDAGKKTAKVTIEANTTANDRTGYISIVSLGGTKTVTVNQPAGSLANSAPMTDWSVWDMTRANAASSPISITSSLAWVARSAAAWITIWPNLGAAGTKAAKVTIDANTTTSDRTGYIRIVSQGGTKVITVNQPAVAPKVHPPAEPSVVETDLIILENLPEGNILEEAGDTKALSATVIPSDATINDTASGSRDTDVDIIYQNGKMNIVGEGASMITASTTNDISAIYTANALVEQSVTSIDISEPEGDHFNNTTYINVYCSGEEEHLEIPCPLGATPESKSIRIDDDWITGGFIRINEIGTDTNTIRIKISRNTTGEIRKGSFTSVFSVTYKVPITDFGLSTTGEKKEPEDGELTILLFSRRFVYTIIQEPFAELSKVEISPKVLNMTVGESKKLDLVFTPSNANYSSIGYYVYDMNGKRQEHFLGFCISVDEYGRITAQKEGEAIVRAVVTSANKMNNFYAECNVTVVNADNTIVEDNNTVVNDNDNDNDTVDDIKTEPNIKIVFHPNGGNGEPPAPLTKLGGVWPDKGKLDKPGYTFAGWDEAQNIQDPSKARYQPGDKLPFPIPLKELKITVYAQWTPYKPPEHVHKFSGPWIMDTEPTCTNVGAQKRPCEFNCGNYEWQTLPATGVHKYGPWTDTSIGLVGTHVRKCVYPGCTAQESSGHTYSAWLTNGSTNHYRSCVVCGRRETANHSMGNWSDFTSTQHRRSCSICNYYEYESLYELSKVEISPKVLNMTVGESKKLDLVFTPYNADYSSIGYYVYDMNGKRQEHFLGFCISVDEYGRITAQKEGEAIVRAVVTSANKMNNLHAECNVTVVKANDTVDDIKTEPTIKIVFHPNGGNGEPPVPLTKLGGVWPDKGKLNKPGYTFAGWDEVQNIQDPSKARYRPGDKLPFPVPLKELMITVYAQWIPDKPPEHVHKFSGSWITYTNPTCTKTGTQKRPCESNCGTYESQTIPATGHKFGSWTDTGVVGTHVRKCLNPGCTAQESSSHTFSAWLTNGSTTHYRSCVVCGRKETANHSMGNWSDFSSTQHRRSCSICNYYEYGSHVYGTKSGNLFYCNFCWRKKSLIEK